MSYMFNCCFALKSLDLSSWETAKVTNMSYMFYYCKNLLTVLVSEGKWITEQANRTQMFYLCKAQSVTYV